MKFIIINGPNMNLLGTREAGIYGKLSYETLQQRIRDFAAQKGAEADFFQSNSEGAIIDAIHSAAGKYDAIIINPAAYTHYSYAIHDAIKAISLPAIEVHVSNVHAREPFRHVSVTAPACVAQITGLGIFGYIAAMSYFVEQGNE